MAPRASTSGRRRARAIGVALVATGSIGACEGALVRVETSGDLGFHSHRAGRGFETTYAPVVPEEVISTALNAARPLGASLRVAPGGRGGASDAVGVERDGDDFELVFVYRSRRADVRGDVLRRVRGRESDEKSAPGAVADERVGTFAPNAREGGRDAVRGAIADAGSRRTFLSTGCGSPSEDEREVTLVVDPLRSYFDARREAPEGKMRAVVIACEEGSASTGAAGEMFADDLDVIEHENVRAVGVFYGEHRQSDGVSCDDEKKSPTGRALLALEASEAPECGLLCETQATLVMGTIMIWGALLALLYGWGLLTDLDTPKYWAKPDEKQD